MRKQRRTVIAMALFRRFVLICAALAAVRVTSSGLVRADEVYNFVDDKVDQNGWSLSGTITTNGQTGLLPYGPVLVVSPYISITETNGATTYAWSPNGIGGAAYATSTEIVVLSANYPTAGSEVSFDNNGLVVEYLNANPSDIPGFGPGMQYSATDPNGNLIWDTANPVGFATAVTPDGSGWVIATAQSAPEPAALTLLGSAFVAAGGFGFLRRRGHRS
jgi:hypothetical protein